MRRYSKNTKYYENPITGETGRSKYSVLPSTACKDSGITVAQYKVLRSAITLPHGLATFAVKGNVLKNMLAAGLVTLETRIWGADPVEIVAPTEKGRAAYRAIAEAA